jgi:peptidoglycan/xylan/chitin deacetylase (PgdA/CDA1 family)
MTHLKNAGKGAMRHPLLRMAAIRVAARRGHGLVLVYHRVRADGDVPRSEVVPSLDHSRLRAQLEALAELGEIVDLPRLLDPPANRRRPRFALTFDDDYPHHAAHALPVLRDVGVPATFFLSGRALHELGPYWWERLEALVAADGVERAGRALGVSGDSAQALAAACETNAGARRRLATIAPRVLERPLGVDGIRALAAAGMTLGFHTLEHPLLPGLESDRLAAALTIGRGELAAVIGRPLTLLAYPHGKADQRVARAAQAAGYAAAWTGWPQPAQAGGDPFLLGRWEPGPLDLDSFVTAVAVRLNRAAPSHHEHNQHHGGPAVQGQATRRRRSPELP